MKSLNSLAVIEISGADAKSFLQGQLSNDINLLSSSNALLTSCNSAQGRVQCILTLIQRDDDVLAVLPASMRDSLILRLRKFILRSKVAIKDVSSELRCYSATREQLNAAAVVALAQPGSTLRSDAIISMRWWDTVAERYLVIRSVDPTAMDGDAEWLRADIRARIPQVLPETHEMFVAQMLNLDLLHGISFNKGCYTGQEIIARAHFRGAVKRRLFLLAGKLPPPDPATRILTQLDGSHAGDVVASSAVDDGCELLAVLNLANKHDSLYLENYPAARLTLIGSPDSNSPD
jgi:folate-binding protein YgfZ